MKTFKDFFGKKKKKRKSFFSSCLGKRVASSSGIDDA
jgi:hypothetical protein